MGDDGGVAGGLMRGGFDCWGIAPADGVEEVCRNIGRGERQSGIRE